MANFKHASIFRKVIESGSMVDAANSLMVTPSVVSKSVADLEARLGTQLLVRTTRRIQITEAGEHFYQTFCQIESKWTELLSEVSRLNEKPAGILTIAAPSLVNSRVLMKELDKFTKLYPDIEFDLRHIDYDELPANFADVSLARDIAEFNSSMYVRVPIYRYVNQLFASPRYIQKYGAPKSLASLSKHSCLAYGRPQSKAMWHFSNGESVSIYPKMWSDNTETLIQAAIQNRGVIYAPELILTNEIKNKLLTPIPIIGAQSEPFHFVAYYRKHQYLPRKCRVFIDFLKNYAGTA